MYALFLMVFQFVFAEPTSVNSTVNDILESEQQLANDNIGMDEPPVLSEPAAVEVEQRTFALSKQLRCPVCQGLSVADSRSDAAVAMKNRIQELVEMGYSDDQIVNYFIGRYGEWALLKPKYEHLFIWIAPVIVSVLGLGFVAWRINRNRERASGSHLVKESNSGKDNEAVFPNDAIKQVYREQFLRELDE